MAALGAAGLVAILGSIILGVWASVRVGVGKMIEQSPAFTWWVISRLLFLAAVGAIQGFAFYFVQDVLQMDSPARVTANLMMVVGAVTVLMALASGRVARAVGRLRLLAIAGIVAAVGTVLLVFSTNIAMVYLSGGLIGLATGSFMAANWAVGTDLVPANEAGRFLGISNLAGAGAGAIGNGIGGPLADAFNAYQPGLGYLVVLAIFALCFVLSSVVLARVQKSAPSATAPSLA
jgi:MFS family permease